jgi:hypothetical protein
VSREKELIRREFLSRQELIVGTVIGQPRAIRFDGVAPGAGVAWVCDIEIGSNNPLFSVPIKGGSHGGRDFANLGQTVLLRRNVNGRYMVVGPGDRAANTKKITEYDLVTQDAEPSTRFGFQKVVDPFEFYGGERSLKGGPFITFSLEAGDDTIDRASGSWLEDGFLPAQSIQVTSPLNSGTFTTLAAGALQLTFSGNVFVDEGPIKGVSIGVVGTSFWNDGVTTWPSRRIIDSNGNTVSAS